jgi:hypothetical protein
MVAETEAAAALPAPPQAAEPSVEDIVLVRHA